MAPPAIAIGNVVGSNIANILLILGVAAAISPIAARIPNLNRDLVMMLVAAVVMAGPGVSWRDHALARSRHVRQPVVRISPGSPIPTAAA